MVNKHKSWTSTVLLKQPNNINRIKNFAWESHPGNNFDFQKIKIKVIKAYLLNEKRKCREGEAKKVYDYDEDVKIRNSMEKLGRKFVSSFRNQHKLYPEVVITLYEPMAFSMNAKLKQFEQRT